jgi:hypothetical protein
LVYRDDDKIPNRKVLLQSRKLFTINWAVSGPGFSSPVAYYVRGCPAIVAAWSPRRPTAPMALDMTTSQSVHLAAIRRKRRTMLPDMGWRCVECLQL